MIGLYFGHSVNWCMLIKIFYCLNYLEYSWRRLRNSYYNSCNCSVLQSLPIPLWTTHSSGTPSNCKTRRKPCCRRTADRSRLRYSHSNPRCSDTSYLGSVWKLDTVSRSPLRGRSDRGEPPSFLGDSPYCSWRHNAQHKLWRCDCPPHSRLISL